MIKHSLIEVLKISQLQRLQEETELFPKDPKARKIKYQKGKP